MPPREELQHELANHVASIKLARGILENPSVSEEQKERAREVLAKATEEARRVEEELGITAAKREARIIKHPIRRRRRVVRGEPFRVAPPGCRRPTDSYVYDSARVRSTGSHPGAPLTHRTPPRLPPYLSPLPGARGSLPRVLHLSST
jgi:hypothetical protein